MKRRGLKGVKKFFKLHRIAASILIVGAVLLAGGGAYAAFGGAPKQAASGDVELSKGLVSWWKLDGNTTDSTAYRNNATAVNGPTLTADRNGASNKAYSFAPASFQHMLGGQPAVSSSFTYSGWFRVNSFYTVWSSVFGDFRHSGTGGANGLNFIPRSGAIAMCWGDNTGSYVLGTNCDISFSSAAVTTGAWIHGAVTYDGTTVTGYINGSSIGSIAKTITHPTTQATIGRWSSTYNDYYFDGKIDDVRMYNRKLSAAEIAALYSTNNPSTNAASGEKGLVGWWKFDGSAVDSTPNHYNGSVTAATLTTDREGKSNSAYAFNGSTAFVGAPTISLPSDVSVSAWVYSTNYGQNGFVAGKNIVNTQWELFFEGGLLKWRGGSATSVNCSAPSNSVWHHVVGTQTGTTATVYIDGVQCGTGSVTAIGNSSGVVEIGRYSGGYYFTGSIDDVRVYNRAITATEVSKMYSSYNAVAKVSDLQKGLVGYWPLNGSIKDTSANRSHLTAIGSPSLATDRKGRTNSSYSLNGTSQYLELSGFSAINNSTGYTYSVWAYPTTFANTGSNCGDQRTYILTEYNGGLFFEIKTDNGNKFSVRHTGSPSNVSIASSSGLSTSQWYHLVAVYDPTATQLQFYVNGVSAGTASTSGVTLSNMSGATLRLGYDTFNCTPTNYTGRISDVRIWKRPLSSTEVTSLYNEYR